MSCSNPIDGAVLADYWLAALAKPEEEAVEEHLLGCDRCGARLREVIALADGLRNQQHGAAGVDDEVERAFAIDLGANDDMIRATQPIRDWPRLLFLRVAGGERRREQRE